MKEDQGWKPNIKQDNILLIRIVLLAIHSLAWAFRTLWVRPGYMGKRGFGQAAFVGLSFLYPLFGQWPANSMDARIFMRSWQIAWYLTAFQWLMAHLLNRRKGIHSQEMGCKVWVGRPGGLFWPALLVGLPGYFLVEPVCHGLGMYLAYGPAFYWLSYQTVVWKQRREMDEIDDARIMGRNIQNRMN